MIQQLKQIDPSVLRRKEFESKRCYENAVWFLEKLNVLVSLHNEGYVIFDGDERIVPELSVRMFGNGSSYVVDGKKVNREGELYVLCMGGSILIGQCRDLRRGRIYVSMKDSKAFFKNIGIVKAEDFKPFREFFK